MFRFFEKALVPTVVPDGVEPPPGLAAFYWHFARQAKPLFIGLFAIGFVVAVIAIAHRLSTIAQMDRLVVLDHGRIVEQGSHGELLRRDGHYAALWRRQSGGFIDAAQEAAE